MKQKSNIGVHRLVTAKASWYCRSESTKVRLSGGSNHCSKPSGKSSASSSSTEPSRLFKCKTIRATVIRKQMALERDHQATVHRLTCRRARKQWLFPLRLFSKPIDLQGVIFCRKKSQFETLPASEFWLRYDHQVSRNIEGKIVTVILLSRLAPAG